MSHTSRAALRQETLGLLDELKRLSVGAVVSAQPSEEGEVWSITDHLGRRRWLKGHLTVEKAAREAEVYRLLQCSSARAVPLSPILIRRLGPRHLLLSDLQGAPLSELSSLSDHRGALCAALPRTLSELHNLPSAAHTDPLPLHHALPRRWRSACVGVESLVQGRLVEMRGLTPAVEQLTSLADELEAGGALAALTRERCLCHRDLNLENIILTPRGEVGLLDFGQARADWWGSDWATLWPHLHARGVFSEALSAYLQQREIHDRRGVSRLMSAMALSRALGTIRWGIRHAEEPVTRRGEAELSAVLSAWDQGEAW